ncbi:hypothetical protein V500_00079 [Pseudogymnoascus sp. VKM F-4518 (FW-2643)]|nr:hypothetical protein V500_00079 [Pseudogymnoascus sp. VKM F-4518 (FW-2643)]
MKLSIFTLAAVVVAVMAAPLQEVSQQMEKRQVISVADVMGFELAWFELVWFELDCMAALTLGQSSPSPSYADVARTPPTSQPSTVQTLSSLCTTPSTLTNTLYCTIDTSRVEKEAVDQISAGAIRTVVESGIRAEQEGSSWRCQGASMITVGLLQTAKTISYAV